MSAYSRTNLSALVASRFLNNSTGLITEAQMRQMFNDFIDSTYNTLSDPLPVNYKGGIAGASVPATLPLAGDYHDIITAGFSAASGKTWAVGDKAVYNGTSGSWTQITGYFAPISSAITTLAAFAGGYPNSDGATSNRASGIYGPFDSVNNPREYVAGAASLTDAMVITVPTASSTAEIVGRSSSITALSSATAWSMGVAWSGNDLVIRCNGATPATDFRTVTFTGLRTTYSGQTIFANAAYTNGTTAPVFSVNGVPISGGTAANGGGTTPDWLSASLVPTYRMVGYNWPAGPAPIVTPILGQTSAADDAFYMQTGKWPAWVVAGGSALNQIIDVSRNSDFSAGATDWTTNGGGTLSVVSNQLSMSGGLFWAGPRQADIINGGSNQIHKAGIGFSVSFDYISGAATQFQVYNGGSAISAVVSATPGSLVVIQGVNSVNDAPYRIRANADWVIDNVKILQRGALSLPSVQPINALDDASGIGGNQGRLLGCTPVTDKTNWRISANTWISGNQQILAGSILDSTKHIIDQVEQSTTGTPTTTVGSASAGAQYKASSALTAGINPTTLVTRKLASNDVWVNSNSTAVVRTTITGHIAT